MGLTTCCITTCSGGVAASHAADLSIRLPFSDLSNSEFTLWYLWPSTGEVTDGGLSRYARVEIRLPIKGLSIFRSSCRLFAVFASVLVMRGMMRVLSCRWLLVGRLRLSWGFRCTDWLAAGLMSHMRPLRPSHFSWIRLGVVVDCER